MSLPLLGAGKSSPGFDPLSLSPSVWFKADALALADGAAVTSWTDSSGNGRHATQGTAANQPTYKTSILNGKPVVRFDGTSDYLATAAWTPGASVSVFAVLSTTDPGGIRTALVHAGSGAWAAPYAQYVIRTNASIWETWRDSGAAASVNMGAANTSWAVVELVAGSTLNSLASYKNGTAGGTGGGTPLAASSQVFWIGTHTSPAEFFVGDIAEILVYPSALSTADRDTVESYLGTKYGITVA